MRFGVLGPLAVWTDDGRSVAIPGAKVRALLAALLLARGRLVSADRLIDDLWDDELPANPTASLQSKVSQLRRALEEAEPGGRHLVRYRTPGYLLDVDADAVDAGRFEALAAQARELIVDRPREAEALLSSALALWRGPAFAEFADAPFARTASAQLEEGRLAAVEDRVEARLALGEHGALVGELDRLVEDHPLRERLRGQHMRALYGAGRQVEALDSYQQLRARLRDELGLEPAREISDLHQQILTQDPALDVPEPTPAERTPQPPTNIPTPRTALVGRDAATQRVCDLVRTQRLVTLTGPGGVGKTRLALAVAGSLLAEHPDGAWVVEMAAQDDARPNDGLGSVAEQVAWALSVQDDALHVEGAAGGAVERTELVDRIAAALRRRKLVLVLDNCEHVVDEAAVLAGRLLDTAPELRILATSRRPLGLSGEQLWSVPPLAVPDAEGGFAGERLERFPAVELFVERAAAADPEFVLTPDNAGPVVDICQRLDGLPLALELAAARLRALPVHELAARLDDRFRVLVAGTRDAPDRQQTLWTLIDWSWELLTPGEQTVLRRLAVFAGAATLPAVEAVCGSDLERDPLDVLDILARLVDHSMVVVEHNGDGARYRLLETIRSYGLARLEAADESEGIRLRHAAFHTELAEVGDVELRGPEQQRWLARFDSEAADLRAAVEWAIRGDAGLALRLAGALAWHWYLRGQQELSSRLLHGALSAEGDAPPAARANALAWLAALGSLEGSVTDPAAYGSEALARYVDVGDPLGLAHAQLLIGGLLRPWEQVPGGDRLIDEALEAFRRHDERWATGAALTVKGWAALAKGDVDSARADGEEAHRIFRAIPERWGEVRSAELLGHAAEIRGDYDSAARLHGTALEAAEALELWGVVAQEQSRLGRLAALNGDYSEAVALHERALRLTQDLSLEQGTVFARVGLGLIARRQGKFDEAEAQFQAILDWHRQRGFHSGVALCYAELGFTAELRGDAQAARELHLAGLEAARRSGDERAVALALEGLAGAAANTASETAAMLLGAAAAARAATGGPLPPAERGDVDRIAATAVGNLGPEAYDAAFSVGEAMGLEEAIHRATASVARP